MGKRTPSVDRRNRFGHVLDGALAGPMLRLKKKQALTQFPIILNTFALSHYCENVRWALDYKRVQYTEKSYAPLLHLFRTWRFAQTYTPILRAEGRVMQESADICDYLEARFPERPLVSSARREEIRGASEEARSVGPHVRRLAYFALGRDIASLEQAWATNVGAREASLHKLVFPLSRRLVFRRFAVNEAGVKESEAAVHAFLDERDAFFAGGAAHLVGDRFSLADLTLASMLSPLVRPAEHPFYPSIPLGEGMAELIESFGSHPTLRWVRECYATYREG